MIEVVPLEKQPRYTADDNAVAREIISPRNSRAEKVSIADILIPAGVVVKPHYHAVIEEIYHVTAGSGVLLLNGEEVTVGVGDTVVIRPGERHGITNPGTTDLMLVVTCVPPWTPDCLLFD